MGKIRKFQVLNRSVASHTNNHQSGDKTEPFHSKLNTFTPKHKKESDPDGEKRWIWSTELSTGFRGNRGSVALTDLRVRREGLKPTIDINAVEPNVSGNRNSVLQRTERRGRSHFLREFGASAARREVLLVETELHCSNDTHSLFTSLVFWTIQLELECFYGLRIRVRFWEEKRRGCVSTLVLFLGYEQKATWEAPSGQLKGKVVVTQFFLFWWFLKLKIIFYLLFFLI